MADWSNPPDFDSLPKKKDMPQGVRGSLRQGREEGPLRVLELAHLRRRSGGLQGGQRRAQHIP